ncbi:MAG: DUF2946 domain-containing protein [Comamonadaceae bacterium]|nr:MAG: DUF2946 domain-containing protein [Comamonadaceae bacterium]
MRPLRAQRLLTTWIAVMAFLMASLAPSLSHALGLGQGQGGSLVEICTGHGTAWVLDESEGPGDAPAVSNLLAHCPGCVNHGPALGLPPTTDAAPLALALPSFFPPAFLQAPRTQHAWRSASQRGPPRFS